MFSLYRAWLMRDAVTTASWTTPPDLIITVGNPVTDPRDESRIYGYQFVAHKHLVSLHSGYLKSLIQNDSQEYGMSVTNITLPNITSESFAPLLSFMYTGYLNLTNENIYSVLLATHLLHMPRALDLCRAYLVQNQSNIHYPLEYQTNAFQPQGTSNVIKPIPSRKIHNFNQSIWTPVNLPRLMIQTRPDGPFQCVSSSEKNKFPSEYVETKSPLDIPSTSKNNELSELSNTTLDFSNSISKEGMEQVIKLKKTNKKKENVLKNNKKINNENIKAEYDVACCDGPIRFHRVLNESYGMSIDEIFEDAEDHKKVNDLRQITEKEYLENYPKTQCLKLKSTNFSNFMHQQMLNSNLLKKQKTSKGVIQMRKIIKKEIEPREKPLSDMISEDGKKEENLERTFTCVYCKHTFKSQYCYQKHAKRHINSVQSEEVNKNVVILRQVVSNTTIDGKKDENNVRREVRLLDMNVQYYPCKTCGSKFPSYYFVHKHRKLCHANEDNFDENSLQPSSDSSSPLSPSSKSTSSSSSSLLSLTEKHSSTEIQH